MMPNLSVSATLLWKTTANEAPISARSEAAIAMHAVAVLRWQAFRDAEAASAQ